MKTFEQFVNEQGQPAQPAQQPQQPAAQVDDAVKQAIQNADANTVKELFNLLKQRSETLQQEMKKQQPAQQPAKTQTFTGLMQQYPNLAKTYETLRTNIPYFKKLLTTYNIQANQYPELMELIG